MKTFLLYSAIFLGLLLPARADLDPGILLLVLKRIGKTILTAHVEPQTKTIRARSLGLFKAGLIDHAEVFPARVAA